ncbi:MAG: iron-containing alcohol dehydrogenase, partial [Bifidobacteriaceae bacterium]|nr:iron-containing alcohol dehydrogenase [Bifidobacteriaceae bacterium]
MPALVCVADAAVCDAHWFAEVVDEHRPDRVVALNAEPTLETVASLAARLNRLTPDKLLVVGGGTVLDTARLAALSLRLGVRAPIFFSRGRQGLLPVPDRLIGPAAVGQMIAVPTTLGTGAETSAVACLLVGDRRRLVMAEALRADVARYFPNCYSTLPGHLIADAILEVVLRVIGPYVVNDAGPADAAAACALRRVDRISEAARTHDPTALAELARLSGETHSPAFSQGRQPFAAPLWYIANELSAATGTSKMHAHRQLLAPWLDAVKRQG